MKHQYQRLLLRRVVNGLVDEPKRNKKIPSPRKMDVFSIIFIFYNRLKELIEEVMFGC